ncbi:hypothetical protein C8R44DRAFT_739861 [Mycena epipterygia]|nr:hypothetical protein C8R44DRAFT_739861 [Mycena epipterygia]
MSDAEEDSPVAPAPPATLGWESARRSPQDAHGNSSINGSVDPGGGGKIMRVVEYCHHERDPPPTRAGPAHRIRRGQCNAHFVTVTVASLQHLSKLSIDKVSSSRFICFRVSNLSPVEVLLCTQWGPGALAGKARLAMGKAVVRSAEHLIILRRMAAIKAAMPCSDGDASHIGNLDKIFDDLLELSRPMLYPETIRIQAMQIILAQIAGKQTLHLRGSISRWEIEHDELVPFLSEIVGVALFAKRGSALPEDWHPWAPCIAFLAGVAQLNEQSFHAVLSARFLETILWALGAQMQWKNYDKILETVCNDAFNIVSAPPTAECILWDPPTSLMRLADSITRQKTWPVVERRLLEMHVPAMLKLLEHPSVDHPVLHSNSVYFFGGDLRDEAYSSARSTSVVLNFLRCLGLGGDVHTETVDYISHLAYPKQVGALAHTIRHLIAQSCVNSSAVGKSMVLFTSDTPEMPNTIVRCLVHIAWALQSGEDALLDAALLVVIPLVTAPWDASKICEEVYRRMHFRPGQKSRPPYQNHTFGLLNEIQKSGLGGVVDQNWTGKWSRSRFPRSHLLLEPAAKTQIRDPLRSNSQPPEHLPSTISALSDELARYEVEILSSEWKNKMV